VPMQDCLPMLRKAAEFTLLAVLFGTTVESLTILLEGESFSPRRAAALGLGFAGLMTSYLAVRERVKHLPLRLIVLTLVFLAVLSLARVPLQGESFGWDIFVAAVIAGTAFTALDVLEPRWIRWARKYERRHSPH
jgi:hypothetical protein